MSNLKVLLCVSDFRYINPGVPKSEGEYSLAHLKIDSSADTDGTSLVPFSRYQCFLWTDDRKGKENVTKPFSSASSRGTRLLKAPASLLLLVTGPFQTIPAPRSGALSW